MSGGFDCGQCGGQCDTCRQAEEMYIRSITPWYRREASGLVAGVALALFLGTMGLLCVVMQ